MYILGGTRQLREGNFDDYVQVLNDYYLQLVDEFDAGRLGHKKFSKSLEKLDEWEQQFDEKFCQGEN